jgi:drug/metabolite transporter (DMT)-like permease
VFAIASLFLVFLTWKAEGRFSILRKGQILPVLLLGLSGVFCYNLFFFKGLKLIEASRAAIIIANNPVFIALFSARCLGLSGSMKVSIKSGQPGPACSSTLCPSVPSCWPF